MRKWSRWLLAGLSLVIPLLTLWWGWVSPHIPAQQCSLTKNGAWISVDWTSEPVNEGAVAQLADQAKLRRFKYLFPFTTYMKADGTFSPSYAYAGEFVSTFRTYNNEVAMLAWIGIPLKNESRFGVQGAADLSNKTTRRQIVQFVAQLMKEAGFDGVHLDVETVESGSSDYLLLLEEVRAALDDHHTLSIAGSYWMPDAVRAVPVVGGLPWDHTYYRAVARRVDQIVVMTYDSLMPHAALYRLWLREQVRAIDRSLAHADVVVLYGLSVSREKTVTHRPKVENMQSGLAGICAGLASFENLEQKAEGIAVYAAWEADKTDWQTWQAWASASKENDAP